MPGLSSILVAPLVIAIGQSGPDFSASMTHHAMAAAHSWQDAVLVALGAVIVIVTTIYTALYFLRPGEEGEGHIKRRIIDDAYEGSR